MKEEIKKKWIEDLRSGKFKQGTAKLYNPPEGEFCCLGVLTHQYCRENGIPIPEKYEEFRTNPAWGDNGVLQKDVIQWAGLNDDDPIIFEKEIDDECGGDCDDECTCSTILMPVTASAANDEFYYSFDEIAYMIEERL